MHPKAAAAGREDLAALGTALGTALEIAGAHSHTVDARVAMAADADPVDTGIVGTDYCEVLAGPLPALSHRRPVSYSLVSTHEIIRD